MSTEDRIPDGSKVRRLAVVLPVLDDWVSLSAIVARLADLFAASTVRLVVVAVDDGSRVPFDPSLFPLSPHGGVSEIRVVRLLVNLGHQRAIAVGLCAVSALDGIEAVIVMDSDGEDRPEDVPRLIEALRENPQRVVMARRERRSETRSFRLGYAAYKLMFRVATGQTINFGNFSAIPLAALARLVRMPELWNNLAAAVMRSRLAFTTMPVDRATRIAGRSTMNFTALIVHGMSAMSVYTDVIFVRILMLGAAVTVASLLGMAGVAAIRLATTLAIPGWATIVVGDLAILLVQTLAVIVATTLLLLASRAQRLFVPLVDSPVFVAGETTIVSPETVTP